MVDVKPTLVQALKELGYPVIYELFLDSSQPTPVITYQQTNDETFTEADNLRYSKQTFVIKVWAGNDLATLASITPLLDSKMFHMGFRRTNYNELWFNQDVCGILTYQGLAKE